MWLGGEQLTSRFLDCSGPAAGRAAQAVAHAMGHSRASGCKPTQVSRSIGLEAHRKLRSLEPDGAVHQERAGLESTQPVNLGNPRPLLFCKGLGHHQAPPTRSVSRELEILYRAEVKFEGWLYLILSYLHFPLIFGFVGQVNQMCRAPFGLALSPLLDHGCGPYLVSSQLSWLRRVSLLLRILASSDKKSGRRILILLTVEWFSG